MHDLVFAEPRSSEFEVLLSIEVVVASGVILCVEIFGVVGCGVTN